MKKIHDNNYYYDIARLNIKKFRIEKGLTQAQLAEKADMSLDYLSEIESLKRQKSFSLATLGRIADALEINIKDFFN